MNILIAEDSKEIVRILELYFAMSHHKIQIAWDGEEAFEYYQKNHYDLIITDYRMPKIDGFVLLEMIREKDRKTPVLLISADRNFEKRDESSLSTYIIKKPFSFTDINRVVQEIEQSIEVNSSPEILS